MPTCLWFTTSEKSCFNSRVFFRKKVTGLFFSWEIHMYFRVISQAAYGLYGCVVWWFLVLNPAGAFLFVCMFSPCTIQRVSFVSVWPCDGLVTCPGCTLVPNDSWDRLRGYTKCRSNVCSTPWVWFLCAQSILQWLPGGNSSMSLWKLLRFHCYQFIWFCFKTIMPSRHLDTLGKKLFLSLLMHLFPDGRWGKELGVLGLWWCLWSRLE